MKIHAFGDSFVVGDQDDFLDDENTTLAQTHGMNFGERIKFLKYNVSFVALIAKELNIELINYAERGSGNFPQLDKLWVACNNNQVNPGDTVLFGMTTTTRDRIGCSSIEKTTSKNYGEFLVDRQLINSHNHGTIGIIDQFYILSVLEKISKLFKLRIIKFNLFDNPSDYTDMNNINFAGFADFVGADVKGNTLIDIINDTWGDGIKNPYHDQLVIKQGYDQYYTSKKHPSVLGHQKIANWFIKNINFKNENV